MTTVLSILTDYLRANGYDGLWNSEDKCCCPIDDLATCYQEGLSVDCAPGYKLPCDCGGGCELHIGPKEETV